MHSRERVYIPLNRQVACRTAAVLLSSAAALAVVLSSCFANQGDAQSANNSANNTSYQKALTLFKNKSYKECLDLLNKSTVDKALEANRLYYAALCLQNLGRESEASTMFSKIGKEYPNSEAAKNSRIYFGNNAPASPPDASKKASPENRSPLSIDVPFRRTKNGQITVKASINGRYTEMIFDTGAEECLISKRQADAAGITEKGESLTLHTVAGPVSAFYSKADLRLGEFHRLTQVCVQEQNMELAILGAPFLQGLTCTIDNRAGLLHLEPEAASSARRIDAVAIPYEEDGAKMIVSAKINNKATFMCFDTGSFGICLSKKQAERLRLKVPDTEPTYIKGPNNHEVPSWDVIADISLGPFSKTDTKIRVLDCDISYPLLGQSFFADKLFTIDRKKKEIRFAR